MYNTFESVSEFSDSICMANIAKSKLNYSRPNLLSSKCGTCATARIPKTAVSSGYIYSTTKGTKLGKDNGLYMLPHFKFFSIFPFMCACHVYSHNAKQLPYGRAGKHISISGGPSVKCFFPLLSLGIQHLSLATCMCVYI